MKIFDKLGLNFFGQKEENDDALKEERRYLEIILSDAYKNMPEKVKICFVNMRFGIEQYKEQIIKEIKEQDEGLSEEELKDLVEVMTTKNIPLEEIKENVMTEEQIRTYDNYLGLIELDMKKLENAVARKGSASLVAKDEKFARMIKVNEEAIKTSFENLLKIGEKIKEMNDRIRKVDDENLKNALMAERYKRSLEYQKTKEKLTEKLAREAVLNVFKEKFMSEKVNISMLNKR